MHAPSLRSVATRPAGGPITPLRLVTVGLLAVAAACLAMAPARAVTIDWATVGDAGNAADTTGYGAVADAFRIMKFEFTNSQYVEFLNTVDPNGDNPYSLFSSLMSVTPRGGITNTGTATGSRYAAKADMGDKPVNYVSWFDAARVANWLQNGQGSGSTETGAYTLVGGQTSGTAPARNPGAQFYIPTENEWYKAAYYKGGNTNAGYWDYATQTDIVPTAVTADSAGIGSAGSTGNFANYNSSASWNDQTGNVTTVGTNGGPSAYNVYDMSGNVEEWNDLAGTAGLDRGTRGGYYDDNAGFLSVFVRQAGVPSGNEGAATGFRLASPVATVPEPSTWALGAGGLAWAAFGAWRRRSRPRVHS